MRDCLSKKLDKFFFHSDVDLEVIEKDGFFDIFYTLKDPGDYDLDIKFGGQNIPNGTFTIKVD